MITNFRLKKSNTLFTPIYLNLLEGVMNNTNNTTYIYRRMLNSRHRNYYRNNLEYVVIVKVIKIKILFYKEFVLFV